MFCRKVFMKLGEFFNLVIKFLKKKILKIIDPIKDAFIGGENFV